MISIVLAVVLANPCLAPIAHKHHTHHALPVQSCIVAAPAPMLLPAPIVVPALDVPPMPAPQLVITAPPAAPAETLWNDTQGYDTFDMSWPSFGGGGGLSVSKSFYYTSTVTDITIDITDVTNITNVTNVTDITNNQYSTSTTINNPPHVPGHAERCPEISAVGTIPALVLLLGGCAVLGGRRRA